MYLSLFIYSVEGVGPRNVHPIKTLGPMYGTYTLALNWNHGGIIGDVHFTGHLMTYGRIEQPSDVIRYTVSYICNVHSGQSARTVIGNR